MFLVTSVSYAGGVREYVRKYPFNYSGLVFPEAIGVPTPTFYCSFDQDQSGATIVCESGHEITKIDATRVMDGTWPNGTSGAQGYASRLDGSGSGWKCPNAECPFNPAGTFSAMCIFTTRDGWAQNDVFMSKYAGGGKIQWSLYAASASGVSPALLVSDDGTSLAEHQSTCSKAASITTNQMNVVSWSYRYVGDGTSVGSVRVNKLATSTCSTMNGPVYNGGAAPADVGIGAHGYGSNDGTIDMHQCWFWDGWEMTDAIHLKIDNWWRGMYDIDFSNPVTVSAATTPSIILAPSDSGTEPFLASMPPNETMVGVITSNTPCIYGSDDLTNIVQRSTFLTWAAGSPTGWSETLVSTGDVVQSAWGKAAHGMYSAKAVLADADDAATITTTACLTVASSTKYWLSAYVFGESGTPDVDLNVEQFSDAACAVSLGSSTVVSGSPGAAWEELEDDITTGATAIRARVSVAWPAGAAQTTYVDAVQFIASETPSYTACLNDLDSSAICSNLITSVPNPGIGVSRFDFSANLMTPFGVLDLPDASVNWYLVCMPSVAVDDAWSFQLDPSAGIDALRCTTHLDGPNYIYDYGGAWLANTVYRARCSYCSECRNAGDIRFGIDGSGYVPGTNYAAIGSGAIRNSSGSGPIYLFSQSTNGIHGCVNDFRYGLRLTQ